MTDRPPTNMRKPSKPNTGTSRTDALFASLLTMYGNLWVDRWTGIPLDAVKREWAADLKRFDDPQVRQALEALKDSGATFPPSLPEFHKLCASFKRTTSPPPLALVAPRTTAPPGTFERIRAILGNVERNNDDEDKGKPA